MKNRESREDGTLMSGSLVTIVEGSNRRRTLTPEGEAGKDMITTKADACPEEREHKLE